jgi:hypothetical protein
MKVLGIGSEIKIMDDEPRTVVAIDKDGITMNDGQKYSKEVVEFCIEVDRIRGVK